MNTDQQPEDSTETEDAQAEAAPPPEASSPPPTETVDSSGSGLSKDSLNMGMLCHLLALTAFLTAGAGGIVGPLVIWLIKKDSDPYVDQQGKESLNFQISIVIYSIVAGLLIFVAIGIFLLPIIGLAWLILTIIGTIKASKGEMWQYPLTIRLIK
ncbi:MAG: DUF4870 domain-containing protein [Opitutales bacterium]|nr:DUF4870 domain-containing protein [Opitutales bacterium]